MSITITKKQTGDYILNKHWDISDSDNSIIIKEEEIAHLVDLLVDIQNKKDHNKKTAPIAFGIGDHPDFKYEN